MTSHLDTAYKVLAGDEFSAFAESGVFAGSPVDVADGYIHLSTAEQVDETVRRHFAGGEGLVIAQVDLTALDETVRWEPSRGGQLFPHVYGVLPITAITAHADLTRDADGNVKLPGASCSERR